jgi:4'-phosphopantetheinyl transferase EntD
LYHLTRTIVVVHDSTPANRGAAMRWADVALAFAVTPLPLTTLTAGERAQLPAGRRRHDWLLGRAALRAHGITDTATVAFPNRCLSLAHAANMAVAARCDGDQAGLGVDLEGWRPIDPRTAPLFLRPGERGDLLRLWTVKEALFKATPDNAGVALVDYEVDDPLAHEGRATDRQGRTFEYQSRPLPEGWLTIAVCRVAA